MKLVLSTAISLAPVAVALAIWPAFGLPSSLLAFAAVLSIAILAVLAAVSRMLERAQMRGSVATAHERPAGATQAFDNAGPQDPLTGFATFQPFSQKLLEEYYRAERTGSKTALVLFDINNLGQINEQFGIAAGDQAIRSVSACLAQTKRASDMAARLGDDEFAVLLQDCDAKGAQSFIERAQGWLSRDAITVEKEGRPSTFWVGTCAAYAVCGPDATSADEVLTQAINGLNNAREARDRRRAQWQHAA